MNLIGIRRAFAGIGTGLALLFAPTTADAAAPRTSVCDTGFRGQPAYDHQCLTRGSQAEAAVQWYTTYPTSDRRAQCRLAWRTGDMVTVVTETRGDMIRDTYTNDRQVIRWAARMGVTECVAMGFKR